MKFGKFEIKLEAIALIIFGAVIIISTLAKAGVIGK